MADANPAMAFIIESLRSNPEAPYAQIAAAAAASGHKIYPIMFGRAKSLLGLIPEGSGRPRRPRKSAEGGDDMPVEDGMSAPSGRRLKQGKIPRHSEIAINELSGFVAKFRDLEEERNRYRAALVNVEKILRSALE